jgi:hypothetical protein
VPSVQVLPVLRAPEKFGLFPSLHPSEVNIIANHDMAEHDTAAQFSARQCHILTAVILPLAWPIHPSR